MATDKQINELGIALSRAKEVANQYANVEDTGTCNFDTPQIFLAGWRPVEVQRAFASADLWYEAKTSGNTLIVDIYGCLRGQASRRTQMAEAMRDSLRNDGYESYVYYQMD